MKKIITACIDQVIQFDSKQEADGFLEQLCRKKQRFAVIWKHALNNGKVLIRVKKQYNNNPMDLSEEGWVDIPEEEWGHWFGEEGGEDSE